MSAPLPCFSQFPSLSQCRDCWAIHPLWHLLKYWFLTKAPVWYTFYALSRFWFVYLQVRSKVMKQIKYLKLFSENGRNAASLKAWINGSWHSLPEDKDFYPFLQNAIRLSWYPFGVWGRSLKNVVCTKHKPWKEPPSEITPFYRAKLICVVLTSRSEVFNLRTWVHWWFTTMLQIISWHRQKENK